MHGCIQSSLYILSAVGTGLTAQFRHSAAFVFYLFFFSRPLGAEGLFLGLRQLFECNFPPEGGRLVRTRFQVGKAQCRMGAGILCAFAALMGLEAGFRVVRPAGIELPPAQRTM